MGKRKRKPSNDARRPLLSSTTETSPNLQARFREKDRFMELVSEELGKRDFATMEEANAFLSANFTGRKMEEMIAEFGRTETPRQKALAILDAVPPTAPSAKARYEFVRALKTDPNCLEAHLALASLEKKPIHKSRFLEEAIAIGRRSFAGLIETVTKDSGLWGYHEARPFMNALILLAEVRENQRRFDEAESIYREILHLNHGDNQGARYELVTLLLARFKSEEALSLIGEYPDEPTCHWMFSHALALFGLAQKGSIYNLYPRTEKEAADAEALTRRIEGLPPEFDEATRALEKALESYPFAVDFLTTDEEGLFDLEEPMSYRWGSPEEVFLYARAQWFLWDADAILLAWLALASERAETSPKARAAREMYRDELARYADFFGWD